MTTKALHNSFIVLLFAYLFLFFFQPLEFEDNWWHLSTGKWILENHQVPTQDPFAFDDQQKTPWVFMQWLGSTVFYSVYLGTGLMGLKVFRALIFVVALGILFQQSYKRLPLLFIVFLILCTAHAIFPRCLLRPLIFNFIFVQFFLVTLFSYQKSLDTKRLFILPFLGLFWGNIHLGSFVYGTLLIFVFLMSAAIQYGYEMRLFKRKSPKLSKQVQDLFLVLVLYFAALLFNPYGIEGIKYPFKVFLDPQFIHFYQYRTDEMQSPSVFFNSISGLPLVILILITGFAVFKNRKDLTLVLLFLSTFFIFLQGVRGIEVFVLACVYILIEAADKHTLKTRLLPKTELYERWLLGIFAMALSLRIFGLATEKVNDGVRYVPKLSLIYPVDNPIAGVDFLKASNYRGAVFNSDTLGGYLIWSSYPGLRPFFDGRGIDQPHLLKFIDIMKEPERYWPAAEKEYRFDIALFKPADARMINYFKTLPQWELLYKDQGCWIFVKHRV